MISVRAENVVQSKSSPSCLKRSAELEIENTASQTENGAGTKRKIDNIEEELIANNTFKKNLPSKMNRNGGCRFD